MDVKSPMCGYDSDVVFSKELVSDFDFEVRDALGDQPEYECDQGEGGDSETTVCDQYPHSSQSENHFVSTQPQGLLSVDPHHHRVSESPDVFCSDEYLPKPPTFQVGWIDPPQHSDTYNGVYVGPFRDSGRNRDAYLQLNHPLSAHPVLSALLPSVYPVYLAHIAPNSHTPVCHSPVQVSNHPARTIPPPSSKNIHHSSHHVCTECRRVFKWKSNLRCHMRNIHLRDAMLHKCPNCPQMFQTTNGVNVHIAKVHKNQLAPRKRRLGLHV
jgi:hypothetical protein